MDPRWLVAAAFLAGVLVTSAVAAGLAVRDDGSSSARDTGSDRSTRSAARTPTPSHRASGSGSAGPANDPSAGTTSSPSVDPAEQQAQMTKPLADLARGDRVVYNMVTCHFRSWVGDGQAVALIACPGEEPFQARTQLLIPVEAGGD